MKSITSKLVVGTLASLAAIGMMGEAASALSPSGSEEHSSHIVLAEQPISEARDEADAAAEERQWQAGDMMSHPQTVTYKITGRVSYARAAAVNVAREAQRQALEVLGKTH